MFRRLSLSLSAWILMALVLIQVAVLYPKWEKPGTEASISWDVFGYYLYLPAFLTYDDPLGLEFRHNIMETYQPAGDFHHAVQAENGNWVMKYAVGQSLTYLPGFLVADVLAEPFGYPADGFSKPYQLAVSIMSLLIAFLGLFVLRKVLLHFFSEAVTAATLVIIVMATNYLNYTAIDGAMTHNALFTLYTLILWLTIRWHEQPKASTALWMGLAIGLATIIRPTDLMIVIIPVFWSVTSWASLKNKVLLLWDRKWDVLLLGLGMFVMGMIQLSYWKYASGDWIFYSYGEFGFDWARPHVPNGLYSFQKGWLIYTPVMILAWIGIIPAFSRIKPMYYGLGLFMALTIYVVFAWEVWWYGGSLGARALVQSYALLALPIAAVLDWVRKSTIATVIVTTFAVGCSLFNLMITYQAHGKGTGWEAEYMTEAYFWKIFFDPNPDRADKKFLDVREELDEDEYTTTLLYHNDFETDSTANRSTEFANSGEYSCELNAAVEFSPAFEMPMDSFLNLKDPWIRTTAKVFFPEMEWDRWKNTQMVMHFLRDGLPLCELCKTSARIQHALQPGQWQEYSYEIRIQPEVQPGDVLKVYFWQAGGQKRMFVDDWTVELVEGGR